MSTPRSQFLTLMWRHFIEFIKNPSMLISHIFVPYLICTSMLYLFTFLHVCFKFPQQFNRTVQKAEYGMIANPLECCQMFSFPEVRNGNATHTFSQRGTPILELVYAPDSSFTRKVFNSVQKEYNYSVKVTGFPTEESARNYTNTNRFAGLVLIKTVGMEINITINMTNQPDLLMFRGADWTSVFRFEMQDFEEAGFGRFLNLEAVLTASIINELDEKWENGTRDKFTQHWKLASFPSWKYVTYKSIDLFLLMYLMIFAGTFNLASNLARALVEEKETGVKDYMKVAGLTEMMYLYTWLLRFAILQMPLNLLLVATFHFLFPILICSNAFLVFVLFNLHHICFGSYAVMVSSLFNNSSLASVTTILSWLVVTLITIGIGENSGFLLNYAMMLFSGYCFYSSLKGLFQLDHLNLGFTWENMLKRPHPTIEPPIVYMLLMSIEIFGYVMIAWYISNVKPGKYGIKKHPLFCFMRSKNTPSGNVTASVFKAKYPELIEEEDPKQIAPIKIVNLEKHFKKFKAVRGINLKAYKNEVLVLLGHNGAGKTTTMSVMTGMLSPTSGTIFINDYDVRYDIDRVRQHLGYCPQYDILFDKMTVKEHLLFFAALKRTPVTDIAASVSRLLHISGLLKKANTKSKNLSGGMQRRLSISIAFVGGSSVVILDEPTAGVDPAFRRLIWNIVESEVSHTTVLLSTHFMDEADYLAQRIAVMGNGEIYCCGTPFFLKSMFQVGYHLTIVKGNDFKTQPTLRIIQGVIPSATLEEDTNTELQVLLPQDLKSYFPPMFKRLEAEKNNLGILNMGITFSGIEDVFLMLDRFIGNSSASWLRKTSPKLNVFHETPTPLGVQLVAVFQKKWTYLCYNKKFIVFQIVLPWLIAAATLLQKDIRKTILGEKEKDVNMAVSLSMDVYKHSNKILLYDEIHSSEADIFRDIVKKDKYVNQTEERKTPISNWLLETAKKDSKNFPRNATFAIDFTKNGTTFYYNQEANIAGVVSGTYLLRTFFHAITKKEMALNFNLEYDSTNCSTGSVIQTLFATDIMKPVAIGFALSSLAASFIFLPVSEQVTKFKQIQIMSGLKKKIYWLGNFIFDLIDFLIILIPIVSLYYYEVFNDSIFLTPMIFLAVLYVPSQLIIIYLLSFAYDSVTTAFSRVYIMYVLGSMMLISLRNFFQNLPGIRFWYDFLCTYVPLYNLEIGLFNLHSFHKSCCVNDKDPCCVKYKFDNFTGESLESIPCPVECSQTGGECRVFRDVLGSMTPGVGNQLLFFLMWNILGPILLWFMEMRRTRKMLRGIAFCCPCFWFSPCLGPCCHCCPPLKKLLTKGERAAQVVSPPGPDEDVLKERERVLIGDTQSDIVVVNRLDKVFGHFVAVKDICVGIPIKECFGLLGINGAGKTTTFRMLIGEETITRGDAFLHGYSVRSNITAAQRYIGYCPQFGGLIVELPADKLLTYIATLRGQTNAHEVVAGMARRLGFEQHLKKPIMNMSGGNQRKVSTAVALIGGPPILFMDEPTTGMDPGVKRKIWSALTIARDQGSCIILTTHSMEECEALCTRLAIMVSGEFSCLGSPQHLKDLYAKGYMVVIKLLKMERMKSESVRSDILDALNTYFPGCTLKESGVGFFSVSIPGHWPWDKLFGALETIAKNPKLFIEDYQLMQASLDDIFLAFTKIEQYY